MTSGPRCWLHGAYVVSMSALVDCGGYDIALYSDFNVQKDDAKLFSLLLGMHVIGRLPYGEVAAAACD